MIWFYRLLFLPALLLALPLYGSRMWRRGGYERDFAHRFGVMRGVPPRRAGVKRIWIQAVSVGELLALQPLLRALAGRPEIEVVLTTTTSTGRALLDERYVDLTVWRGFFPLDFAPSVASAWRCLQPDLALLMESELWPEHLHQARLRRVPVALVNARMSDRSARRYGRLAPIARRLLAPLSAVFASSEEDARRFAGLGLTCPIETVGNLKLDLAAAPRLDPGETAALRRELGFRPEDLIVVGASTWPGEEQALAGAVATLRAEGWPVRALLIPRHAERRGEIAQDLAALPVAVHFRSTGTTPPTPVEIYVADTTGELRRLIQLADVAFIGKSLPPHTDGQTPIEAAWAERSIVFGPGMSNFRMITAQLRAADAGHEVCPATLTAALRERLADATRREAEGRRAGAVIAQHTGSTARLLSALDIFLRTCS